MIHVMLLLALVSHEKWDLDHVHSVHCIQVSTHYSTARYDVPSTRGISGSVSTMNVSARAVVVRSTWSSGTTNTLLFCVGQKVEACPVWWPWSGCGGGNEGRKKMALHNLIYNNLNTICSIDDLIRVHTVPRHDSIWELCQSHPLSFAYVLHDA